MLNRVNVDFQKQTVGPMQVSFNPVDRSRTTAELLLTVDVTEVRMVRLNHESFSIFVIKKCHVVYMK